MYSLLLKQCMKQVSKHSVLKCQNVLTFTHYIIEKDNSDENSNMLE